MRNVILLAVSLFALLGAALWGVWELWFAVEDVEMSIHGFIALAAGSIFTLLLGGGLMWLAFYSSKHGYDEREIDPEDDR
ncbi:hypothetical protein NUH88_04680 [Nisaea acidiphila]|uniref:Uncharacterized protein n=1 Tax=Nisaea acidiphila TaxID=1862145 RepID=A0A9J7AZW3_9PROT|nr:hypothetical protein [Nisaea acidiphila]UUX50989.1 hypothetical protein NUH88_04680 [Nisaea acidiphila]